VSNLSQAEQNAGVSRRALATLLKKQPPNGNGNTTPTTVSDGAEETYVIETTYRKLSLLEDRNGDLRLRDVGFIGNKVDLQMIHLDREQARTLANMITKLLRS